MEQEQNNQIDKSIKYDTLSTAELGWELLKFNIPKETIEILEDEGIDGLSFLELTEADLSSMKIKIGPRKKIMMLIRKQKEVADYVVEEFIVSDDGNFVDSNSSQRKENLNILVDNNNLPSTSTEIKKVSQNIFSVILFIKNTCLQFTTLVQQRKTFFNN
ncbi:uncharacterized protein LOC122500410 isoform X2 [Leptopilina heterotoma]|uniref:uncharacterized protein LOC122500410 isoform X2 n=1 Tax=Leptopilina heterotoma TaxID=63436 RepID=UPI001CA915BF|nr:uncharacterized protein LOC122500410 isoform X2 [Leptopilina heterotoma]